MDRLEDFRNAFSQVVVARASTADPRLLRAFAHVPRHAFVGPGPWRFSEDGPASASDDPALLYQDVALGLAPERGITTGLPSLHARCMAACGLAEGERVVHVGTGAGYFTAILAELVGRTGSVVGFELDGELAKDAARNLLAWKQTKVVHGLGVSSELTSADVIYVSAGVQEPPSAWLDALAPGGRLLFPLTPGNAEGAVLLVHRGERGFSARFVTRARFVPCVGALDAEAASRLGAAFARGGEDAVRSLRRAPEEPDESAWYAGRGWWLSTRGADA